jgi:hypothetical protein
MVAVDDHQAARAGHGVDQRQQILDPVAAVVEHVTEPDQVMATAARGSSEAFGKTVEGLDRDALDLCQSGLLEAPDLPLEAQKLAVGGQHPQGPRLDAGQQAQQKLVRIAAEADRRRVRQVEQACQMMLRRRHDLAEHLVPFRVHQRRGIEPGLLLGVEAHVRPRMVAVRAEMQASRVMLEKAREMQLEAHRAGSRSLRKLYEAMRKPSRK